MSKALRIGIALLVLLGFAAGVWSEESPASDEGDYSTVVLLTTGGKVTGRIISDEPSKEIVIERKDGHQVKISDKKIDRISRSGGFEDRQRVILDSVKSPIIKRINPHVHLRLPTWKPTEQRVPGTKGDAVWEVSITVGTMAAAGLFVGGGIGYELAIDYHESFLPIYGEAQYYLGENRITPFVFGRAGWSLGWLQGVNGANFGGAMFGAGIGVIMTMQDRAAITFALGYSHQGVSDDHPVLDDAISGLQLELGVMF